MGSAPSHRLSVVAANWRGLSRLQRPAGGERSRGLVDGGTVAGVIILGRRSSGPHFLTVSHLARGAAIPAVRLL